MKKFLLTCAMLATINLQGFELPCFRTSPPPQVQPITNSTPQFTQKNILITTEETTDAFTLVDTVAAGSEPDFITYSHDGKFAAVTNGGDNTVSVYGVDCEIGTFSAIEGSPFTTGVFPTSIAYSPCDNYAAVTNFGSTTTHADNSVTVYSVHCETGALTLVQTLTNATNPEIVSPHSIAYSPDGRFAAVANFDAVTHTQDNITIYRVSKITGKLTFISTIVKPNEGPFVLTYSPNGRFLAVTREFVSQGSTFQVDPFTGNLFNELPFIGGVSLFGVAYSHSGNLAAVASYNSAFIQTYFVNPVTGEFIQIGAFNVGTKPSYVAFSSNDSLLAVTNTGDGTVTLFCVDQTTGLLTLAQTVDNPPPVTAVIPEASGIQFAPCNDFAAVTSFGGDTVRIFSVEEGVCP